jgi:hypothetical protein
MGRSPRLLPRHSREGGNLMAGSVEIPAFAGMTGGAGMTAKRMAAEGPA